MALTEIEQARAAATFALSVMEGKMPSPLPAELDSTWRFAAESAAAAGKGSACWAAFQRVLNSHPDRKAMWAAVGAATTPTAPDTPVSSVQPAPIPQGDFHERQARQRALHERWKRTGVSTSTLAQRSGLPTPDVAAYIGQAVDSALYKSEIDRVEAVIAELENAR